MLIHLSIISHIDQSVSCEFGVSNVTFYKWKQLCGGLLMSSLLCMRELEDDYSWLKKMFANLSLMNYVLKDAVAKKI